MSSSERLLMILHIGFAIFAIGPLTIVTSAFPRYIRLREISVLRYFNRATRLYALLSLGVFLFGVLLADGRFAEMWLSVSMTLFVVAIVLLLVVERDQRSAVRALEEAAQQAAAETEKPAAEQAEPGEQAEAAPSAPAIAQVEQGRIAALSGIIALIWLVTLVLMVWFG